jgi:Mn2+/Fe2+ NRAMP family transporter
VNVFEVFGPILIAWAVLVGILGITRENFPGSKSTERVVGAVSVILVIVAIGSAVYATAHEHHEKGKETAVPHQPV